MLAMAYGLSSYKILKILSMTKHLILNLKHVKAVKVPFKKTVYKYFDYVFYAVFLFILMRQLIG